MHLPINVSTTSSHRNDNNYSFICLLQTYHNYQMAYRMLAYKIIMICKMFLFIVESLMVANGSGQISMVLP